MDGLNFGRDLATEQSILSLADAWQGQSAVIAAPKVTGTPYGRSGTRRLSEVPEHIQNFHRMWRTVINARLRRQTLVLATAGRLTHLAFCCLQVNVENLRLTASISSLSAKNYGVQSIC